VHVCVGARACLCVCVCVRAHARVRVTHCDPVLSTPSPCPRPSSEFNSNRVRKVDLDTGIISTPWTLSGGVHGIAIDPTSRFLLVTTWTGGLVIKVGPGITQSTVAGGGASTANNVVATSASLSNPTMVCARLWFL
jgi:hypothetical protein